MSAMERLGHDTRRSPSRKIPGYFFLTPVWGREYTRLYVDVVIPAQLAAGNLPVFRNDPLSRYIIYTTADDANAIRASAAFRALSEIIAPIIEIIDEEIK